ncbi:uncharacterized protein P174DRAFT_419879 [Aspergillus novofumigatus IBT 16806]|uniref:Uncharacterized protein n=1 Tax=Aspergillus novofumigatus (strain IBT 16806) TaxID=1392255 RepID=A0A2I1CEC0_ASPN1|nr:uncharacterized protein P174DRAFT_419879 [Aspergillus novofumigatus IBT 16806]PKX95987.1 hypothetical protein P174DRAFT_419879 [Aspergillus novofumigatus IBT 16806]
MSHLEKLPNVTLLKLDVVPAEGIVAAVKPLRAQSGRLKILVNIGHVNFFGVIVVAHAFALLLLTTKGAVVDVYLSLGFLYAPWMSW